MRPLAAIAALLLTAPVLAGTPVDQGMPSHGLPGWNFNLPSYQRGAFGPIAVESEEVRVHLQFPYSINSRLVSTTTANGGTVTQANNLAVLQMSAAASGSAKLESLDAIKYTPGQGVVIRFTAVFAPCTANSQQEVGVGDANDGFFYGCQGATFGIFRRQNGTDFFTAQVNWNGSPEGTFDPTKGNVYQIEYQWLGFGAIRWFLEDPLTGAPILVHTIMYANANTIPSIYNPSLPLHARVFNGTNATNLSLSIGSMGAAIQGPHNDFGVNNAAINSKSGVGTTTTNIFTLQNRSTFNGLANRTRLRLTSITAATTSGTANTVVRVIHAGTEGGVPSFTNLDTTRSIAAIDTAGTTVTGGDLVLVLANSGGSMIFNLEDKDFRLNPGDTYNFTCEAVSGTVNCTVGVSWREGF